MTKKQDKVPSASDKAATVVVRDGKGPVRSVYSFGSAKLQSSKGAGKIPPETLEQSRNAMRQLGDRLLKPGVKLPDRKGVPKFYVDEADPALVVRELDGKRERGRFENGQFKAVA
jgi:hypothetical protein